MKNILKFTLCISTTLMILVSCNSDKNAKAQMQNQQTKIEEMLTVQISDWELATVTNEKGKKGMKGIVRTISGKMTNVAIRNAPLKVNLQIADDKTSYIRFQLMSKIEAQLPQNENFDIRITKENGESEYISQYATNNVLVDKEGILIEKVLSQNSPLKVNIVFEQGNKSQKSIYDFEIDPKGLNDMIAKL